MELHFRVMWVYSWKVLLCCMKGAGSESSQRQELCNVWFALSLLLGAFSSQRRCLWASNMKDNPGEARFPCCLLKHVEEHKLPFTATPPSAFPPFQALTPVSGTLMLSSNEQRDRKRGGFVVLGGKCCVTCVPSYRLQACLCFWLTVWRQKN